MLVMVPDGCWLVGPGNEKAEPLGALATYGGAVGVGRPEFVQVERHHADAVGCIEEDLDAPSFELGHQPFKRHQQAGGADDGVDLSGGFVR